MYSCQFPLLPPTFFPHKLRNYCQLVVYVENFVACCKNSITISLNFSLWVNKLHRKKGQFSQQSLERKMNIKSCARNVGIPRFPPYGKSFLKR